MPGRYVRGDVVYVDLEPARGSEPDKIRPCLVIQNDIGNRFSSVTIVAAITGAENVPREYPIDVPIPAGEGGLEKPSVVQCNLIRCIDETRIRNIAGRLAPHRMRRVDRALRISLALDLR